MSKPHALSAHPLAAFLGGCSPFTGIKLSSVTREGGGPIGS